MNYNKTIQAGTEIAVQANILGTAYLVPHSAGVNTKTDLEQLVTNGTGSKVSINVVDMDSAIETTNLAAGQYVVYLVATNGEVITEANDIVTIEVGKVVNNNEELTMVLTDLNVKDIKLGFNAQDINVNRLVNIDMQGYTAENIVYDTEEDGEVSLANSGTPTTIENLTVTAPNATFNLNSGITVNRATVINNVAVGTFNTKAQHNGKVTVKDPDGGSINFTDSTVNGGIEINPEFAASEPVIIRGVAPSVSTSGNATIKILGSNPKVLLEGTAHDILIEAPNTEFELSVEGDASKITIAETAEGSKITTSKHYEFELLFTEGQTVSDMTSSGLFGDKEIRVVGYPSEEENINVAHLLKLDGDLFSNVYTFETSTFNADEEYVVAENGKGKFRVSKDEKKVYLEGEVTGKELRKYLEDQSQDLFEIAEDWLGDGKVVISFYDIKANDIELIESDTVVDNKLVGMRVLVGTNEQHGLYILMEKQ